MGFAERALRPGRSTTSIWLVCLLAAALCGAPALAQDQPAGQPGLEDFIAAALKNNPSAAAAAWRVEAARAMITQAESAFLPRLSLTGNYARTDNPPQAFMMSLNQRKLDMRDPAFDPNNPDDTDNFRFSLGAKYRLFDGGRNFLGVDMAKLGASAGEAQLSMVRNELIHQVTRAYYRVLQAQAMVEVRKASVDSLERNLGVAQELFKAGTVVETDVLNLKVQLAQAREELIRAENAVQLALAGLNNAVGADMAPDGGLKAPPRCPPAPLPDKLDLTPVEQRPELAAARQMTKVRQRELTKAWRGWSPVVSAFGSYDWDSGDLSEYEGSYFVGVQAEWEFFSGFQRSGEIAQAKAKWRAAAQEEQKALSDLRLDLRQAHYLAAEARQRLGVAGAALNSAGEALRITQVRYREGAASITELLVAEVGHTATVSREVAAYYDYLIALSNLKRARGELVKERAGQACSGPAAAGGGK